MALCQCSVYKFVPNWRFELLRRQNCRYVRKQCAIFTWLSSINTGWFHFFFFFFFTSCFVPFFSVIKIDQSFTEEDFHLWLNNSWGRDQESPTMWVLSFFVRKKKKLKYIHTHAHKHAHTFLFYPCSSPGAWWWYGARLSSSWILFGWIHFVHSASTLLEHTQLGIDALSSFGCIYTTVMMWLHVL